jgi:hypothetical protein
VESVVGPWARDKLERSRKYLSVYTTIMKDQDCCEGYHYIDAFAGPGGHTIRQGTADAGRAAAQALLDVSSYMAIQKLLLRQPENFTDAQRRRLDEYFGSPDWSNVLYKRRRTLFGDDAEEKVVASGAALLKWYRDRLRAIFPHVSKAALIRNTRGGHLYYLLLASHNRTGVKIADDILSAGETV